MNRLTFNFRCISSIALSFLFVLFLPISLAQESAPAVKADTRSGNIITLKGVKMTPFTRQVDIEVYLPKTYEQDQSAHYPVLYMLDGQNLFNEQTSYAQEWHIDEILEGKVFDNKGTQVLFSAMPEVIVVAIPNSDARMTEYNPWDFMWPHDVLNVGEGDKTMQAITKTLIPLINKSFRTLPERNGLAGSSLGGLMAIYAAVNYANDFEYVLSFSPSMGIMNAQGLVAVTHEASQIKNSLSTKIYVDMGKLEYGDYIAVDSLISTLTPHMTEMNDLKMVKDDLGEHRESSWAKRFPHALKWALCCVGD